MPHPSTTPPRPPLPPASSQIFSDQIDWTLAAPPFRSSEGRTAGVYRFELPDQRVVIKAYSGAQAESLGARLAGVAGLRVPTTVLERHNAPYLRCLLQLPPTIPIMALDLVDGQDITDLSGAHVAALAADSPHFPALMQDVGRVCALDYLIGNIDRLPLAGLAGFNRGNLMLQQAALMVIDSTLATPPLIANRRWLESFQRGFIRALRVAKRGSEFPNQPPAFAEVVDYFSTHVPLSWQDACPHVLAGFRHGAAKLIQLGESGLNAHIDAAERNLPPLDATVKQFLYANLRALARADL